jgi:divalent metal cation (Fe/Co/Zn/Cd) transporter
LLDPGVLFVRYPEGRGRIEPIGVLIFATVMCLSSLNILIESIKIVVDGYLGKPPDLEVNVPSSSCSQLDMMERLC